MLGLADLEDLVARCRHARARSLIREAVDCYHAGAYRSCVVATWIALVYDIIDKLRELALTGDATAKIDVSEFDRIQRERDTDAALKFERTILEVARDKYELVSSQEYADLKRLFEDRNRFGHPNLNQDLEEFRATPELARTHLRNAIEHLMERPPVQGKAALSRICEIVDSEFFPVEVEDALEALKASPLARAKKKLIGDFYLGAVSSAMIEEMEIDKFRRRVTAARACHRLHVADVDSIIVDKLAGIFEKVPDSRMLYVVAFLSLTNEVLAYVPKAIQLKLDGYISKIPESDFFAIPAALKLPFLQGAAEKKLRSFDVDKTRRAIDSPPNSPHPILIDHVLNLLEGAGSFDTANAVARLLDTKFMPKLSVENARRILNAGSNGEVKYSHGYPVIVKALLDRGILEIEEIERVSAALGLEDVLSGIVSGKKSIPAAKRG